MRTPGAPTLHGWGRIPVPGRERLGEDLERLTDGAVLTRGLGRSYGDASLPAPGDREVVSCRLADRIRSFDADSGLLRAEAGLSLEAINALFLRRGWFVPVSPGTQFVTLGGMVAADVHGKNHHVDGSIGEHVTRLRIRVADGRILEVSPDTEPELFRATLGGMGLTGHLLEVELRMRRIPTPWIFQETERIPDLETFVAALGEAGKSWPMTVGWLDALSSGRDLGRGLLMRGRWAAASEAPPAPPPPTASLTVPVELPEFVLARPNIRLFNELFYRRQWRQRSTGVVHPDSFFYPLDMLLEWNRMYGRRGFIQYQCVIPQTAGPEGVRRFLELVVARGGASFLCVIKDCGAEGTGTISFPRPGISLALDIAVRDDTPRLVDALNERLLELGGRVYLAKDQLTRAEHFRAMEPRLDRFLAVRRLWDPAGRIRSAQSVRLFDW